MSYIIWGGHVAAEEIGILYSTNNQNGIRPFELYIETPSWVFEKKTPMPVSDPYSAQKEAEDHTTSHSGYVETADEAFEREKASIKCYEESWDD